MNGQLMMRIINHCALKCLTKHLVFENKWHGN